MTHRLEELAALCESGSVIAKIVQYAEAIARHAGVGSMETAGSIVSYLATHPDQIEPFMAGKVSVLDWPVGWHEHGCLTWHGQDGKIYGPEDVARALVAGEG